MIRRALIVLLMLAPPLFADDVVWGPVEAGRNVTVLRVPGKVIPREGGLSVESARVQGRVTNIIKREGESVTAGDPLFIINSAECVSLAEEQRVAQERGLQDLIEGARVRQQQLGLRVHGGDCDVLATHAGTIVKRQVELGAAFNVGDALATILDVRNLTVELDLPERDLALVKPGQKVALQLPSFPGQTIDGVVERILPSIDPQTRTSTVRLAKVRLPPGVTMDALVLAEISVNSDERILKVPTTALVFHENRQYVVKKADHVEAVPVEVVSETDNVSSVRPWNKEQLRADDQIAVKGAIFVYNTAREVDAPRLP